MSTQKTDAPLGNETTEGAVEPKEGSKLFRIGLRDLVGIALLIDLVVLIPVVYQKGRPWIAHYMQDNCFEDDVMKDDFFCNFVNKYAQIPPIIDTPPMSSWSPRIMNATNGSTSNETSSGGDSGNQTSSGSGNQTDSGSDSGANTTTTTTTSSSSSGNSAAASAAAHSAAVAAAYTDTTNYSSIVTSLQSMSGSPTCESLGCPSGKLSICSVLSCWAGGADEPITFSSITETIGAGATSIPLADTTGFDVGDTFVIMQSSGSALYHIIGVTSSGRRLDGGSVEIAAPGLNEDVTPPAGAAEADISHMAATTTTHDLSTWWGPTWAWFLVIIGGLCCAGAIAAGCVTAMFRRKKVGYRGTGAYGGYGQQGYGGYGGYAVNSQSIPMTMATPSSFGSYGQQQGYGQYGYGGYGYGAY